VHQRELLPKTKEYFRISDRKDSALQFYESYSDHLISGSFLVSLSAGFIWALGGGLYVGIFGFIVLGFALALEILFQYITQLSG